MVDKPVVYDWKIGLKKTAKNVAVMFGAPAVLYVLANVADIVPKEWLVWAVPLSGAVSYAVKNYIENH